MLRSMRSSISSWFVKLILAVIVASFILSYGFQGSDGLDQGVIARVNGHNITDRDLSVRFQSRLQAFRQFFQKDIPEALLRGLQQEVSQQLINEQLYARAAQKMGMTASPASVKDTIRKQFSDETGGFDFDRYQKIVQSYLGKSTGSYEKDEKTRLVAEDFQNLVTRTAWVSQANLRDKYESNNTKVTLSYVKLDADRLKGKLTIPATQQELEAYYKSHEKKYEVPEKNRYAITWISMEDSINPDKKDLEKTLRDTNPEKTKGTRIHAAHILLKTTPSNEAVQKKKIEALRQKIAAGENFETLASLHSEDGSRQQGGDLGYFGQGDMVPEFEKAAASLKPQQISGVIKTSFGFHLVKVYDKIDAGAASVDRLKNELTYVWKKKYFENQKKVEKLAKQVEAKLKQANPADGVKTFETPLLSKEDSIAGLPLSRDSQLLLASSSSLKIGETGNVVRSLGLRHLYTVKKLESAPAQSQPFEKVQSIVKADFEKEKQQEALKTFATQTLEKAVASNTDLPALARSIGLPVEKVESVGKQSNGKIGDLGVNQTLVDKLFAVQQVPSLVAEVADIQGQLFLIRVDAKVSPDWEKFEKEKIQLRTYAAEEEAKAKLETWATYLRSKAKIDIKGS